MSLTFNLSRGERQRYFRPPISSQPILWTCSTLSIFDMRLGLLHGGGCPSNVPEIFQSLLDDALFGLVHFRRVVAQEFLQHESEKLFHTAEPRPKLLLGTFAQSRRQLQAAQFAGHGSCGFTLHPTFLQGIQYN